jgi:hypothetical protein
MVNDALEVSRDVGDKIDRVLGHVEILEQRMDDFRAKPVEATQSFIPYGVQSFFTRALVALIVGMQLLIGGLIAYRLGPQGYSRVQAKANWAQFCHEVHKYHSDFVCPTIAIENDE